MNWTFIPPTKNASEPEPEVKLLNVDPIVSLHVGDHRSDSILRINRMACHRAGFQDGDYVALLRNEDQFALMSVKRSHKFALGKLVLKSGGVLESAEAGRKLVKLGFRTTGRADAKVQEGVVSFDPSTFAPLQRRKRGDLG